MTADEKALLAEAAALIRRLSDENDKLARALVDADRRIDDAIETLLIACQERQTELRKKILSTHAAALAIAKERA